MKVNLNGIQQPNIIKTVVCSNPHKVMEGGTRIELKGLKMSSVELKSEGLCLNVLFF